MSARDFRRLERAMRRLQTLARGVEQCAADLAVIAAKVLAEVREGRAEVTVTGRNVRANATGARGRASE